MITPDAGSAEWPSAAIDSLLFRDAFGTPQMREIFSDHATIARYIEVEIALARAQGGVGVIPSEAAEAIARCASSDRLDFERLRAETATVGYPILPLVRQLVEQCGEAGRYVHWGATTQDIMDTATVLQVRDALELIAADLDGLRAVLTAMAQRYRDTPMAGRTHLQQAVPVTFGYKAAIWLAMFDRHAQRLRQIGPRVAFGQFGGAGGTLASLGERGLEVQRALMDTLGLAVPDITWHVARDSLAEAVNLLALITGSLGKIAYDVMIMASTEFGELSEPFVSGRGSSSTMPQKRNPISSEIMLALAKAVRQRAGLMADAVIQDFERATGPWHAEWIALPESFVMTAGSLNQAKFMLGGLSVNESRMRANLDLTSGLITAEAVMMALAPNVGRESAHEIVYGACRMVDDHGGRLVDVLASMSDVSAHLDREALNRLTDPANYLGMAPQMVDQAIARSREIPPSPG